jgi:DNA repair exonuclease SbcCD ATPase subunit/predicted MPP superfamily phosphohydrolase
MSNQLEVISTAMTSVDHIIHISDVHIRKRERHGEYQIVFDRLIEDIKKYPNAIVMITGDTVHDKTELVPESIDMLRRLLISLTDIMEVVIIIGNHDVNIFNVGSLDSLSPIITDLRTKNPIHLLNENKGYRFGQTNIVFGVTTIWAKQVTDIDEWDMSHIDNPIKIALYHGMIHGCTLDNGIKALNNARCTNSSYFNVSDFDSYDLALLGDVHKHQFLKADRTVAYAGSLIQQKRDEDLIEHGYILWNIKKNGDIFDLSAEFKRVPSDYGMIDIEIPENIDRFLKNIDLGNKGRPKKSGRLMRQYPNSVFPQNLDVKLRYSTIEARDIFKKVYNLITETLGKNIVRSSELLYSKKEYGFAPGALRKMIEFGKTDKDESDKKVEKIDKVDKVDKVEKDEKSESDGAIFKIGGNDVVIQAIMNFYDQKFDKSNQDSNAKTRELIRKETVSLLKKIKYNYESDVKNIKLKTVEFDNMLIYLDGNMINFDKFEKIVGLNAGNFKGKSGFIDVVLYAIYGVCSRGKRFDILNIKKNTMMSRISLEVNGVEYVITRNSYINSRKNRDLKESVIFCESGRDITADDRVKTHKLIESKICSYSDMVNNSFILQKNGSSFTDLTDRQKKDLLCKMARLDVFDQVFHEAKSRHFSHSQNFGKTVRKLDPLMNKYLDISEIQSILPKSKSKKAADQSNQRKLDLINDTLRGRSKDMRRNILKRKKRIINLSQKLTDLEKKESTLTTEKQYEDQSIYTLESYDTARTDLDARSVEVVRIIDAIRKNENDLYEVLNEQTQEEILEDYNGLITKNQKSLDRLNAELLDLHTKLGGLDRSESDVLDSLIIDRDNLINYQDRLIELTKKYEGFHNKVTILEKFKNRDGLIIRTAAEVGEIESSITGLETEMKDNVDQIRKLKKSLSDMKDHEYNRECEQCMSNPMTKSILHYEKDIQRLIESNRDLETNIKERQNDRERKRFIIDDNETIDCIDRQILEEATDRPNEIQELEQRKQLIKNEIVQIESDIRIVKSSIENDKNILDQVRGDQMTRKQIDQTRIEILERQNSPELKSLSDRLDSVNTLTIVLEELRSRLREQTESIRDLRIDVNRYESMNISEIRIKLIGSLDESTLPNMREEIGKRRLYVKKLERELNTMQTDLNEVKLDLERFVDIRRAIRSESNSKLVLEQIKKLLDRSGLVDDLLTNEIIPHIQNRINTILSDVGHYRIDITYRNQSVNIYKDDGLNISMSSGYESYLLDLVFRLALVQINNHIRTDFLIIDEGFNACDSEHKDNIRDLLEYMRNFYSWILVVSHDDYIKSFYDQSIEIRTVTGLSDDDHIIEGSRIVNIEKDDTDLTDDTMIKTVKYMPKTSRSKTARSKTQSKKPIKTAQIKRKAKARRTD